MEADFPFHIKIDRSEKNFDIRSISFDDFGGQLKHNVSAHPKVDQKTGELMAFGYDMLSKQPCVHYSLINKDRKVISSLDCPITSARMIHDFGATENHVIIPDLPLLFDAEQLAQGKSIFSFDKKCPAKYGIMKRLNQDVNQIMWFEFPSHYVFHYVNAWEEKNEAGQTIITLWGAALDDVNLDFYDEHPFHAREDDGFSSKLSRMTFNLATGEKTMEQDFISKSVEFPVVPQTLIGYKTRYAYMSYQADKTPTS